MVPLDRSVFGRARSFTAEELQQVAFPLGGIGTGTVSLGGRGQLRDWEVLNRPAKGRNLPYSFFALWARPDGGSACARVLERRLLPPFDAGFGVPTSAVSGLPRLREARFRGAYPLAEIDFDDPDLPVRVRLSALNPFIPMNDCDSGIPCAVFLWEVTNPGLCSVEASICFSCLNPCGLDGAQAPGNRYHESLGGNLNEMEDCAGGRGIRMTSTRIGPDDARHGTLAIVTPYPDVTWQTRWERAGWWDDVQSFWDRFCTDGRLDDGPSPEPSPEGQSDVGSIACRIRLEAGSSAVVPFILAWHFPHIVNDWNSEESVRGQRMRTWYSGRWSDAWDVATYVSDHLERLVADTALFTTALMSSTAPDEVLDAVSANASIMRTTTCLRTDDGRFHGFEGCGDNRGCCPMNCTHVWNYEQAVAYLFPALERTMRRTDFAHNTRADGYMAFRTLLPLKGDLWAFKPAADGQMGTVMKVYREWLQSGDREFLKEMWPNIVRALEFAWRAGSWDADADGVMEGEQHNTYDIEFYGPNTMMGTLYLGALRAAEEMARELGDTDRAARYRAVFEAGSSRTVEQLWNGEYFEQAVVPPDPAIADWKSELRYQYGQGCLSDHLLGQWFARVVGLGDLLPGDKVRSAIGAVHRHNFRRDLSEHHSVQRVYAVNDEAGLLLCTWPRGGRPRYPFPYADEVWTGIEYQVAAHLIYEGLVDEGLEVVRGVRSRHDGRKRNPWNEFECGHHYARAMASWSVLTALSGCLYSAPSMSLAFEPRIAASSFATFYTAGTAWGTYRQAVETGGVVARLAVDWGAVTLRALCSKLIAGGRPAATLNGVEVACSPTGVGVSFDQPVSLSAGDELIVRTKTG